jgi:hypothetical protein
MQIDFRVAAAFVEGGPHKKDMAPPQKEAPLTLQDRSRLAAVYAVEEQQRALGRQLS